MTTNIIRREPCTSPDGTHDYEVTGRKDWNKGYSLKCNDCGKKFYLVSEEQMEKLLEHLDLNVTFQQP